MAAMHCTAITARGRPCRGWAVPGSDPPRCAAHGCAAHGCAAQGSDPQQSANRDQPVVEPDRPEPSVELPEAGIDGQIDDLDRRIQRLGAYIDEHQDELEAKDWLKLLNMYSMLIGRVTRVRETRERIRGGADQALTRAISEALDMISEEWGIEL